MTHIAIDEYYLEEQDEPTVRERLAAQARKAPENDQRSPGPQASLQPIARPVVLFGFARRDDREPLVA